MQGGTKGQCFVGTVYVKTLGMGAVIFHNLTKALPVLASWQLRNSLHHVFALWFKESCRRRFPAEKSRHFLGAAPSPAEITSVFCGGVLCLGGSILDGDAGLRRQPQDVVHSWYECSVWLDTLESFRTYSPHV